MTDKPADKKRFIGCVDAYHEVTNRPLSQRVMFMPMNSAVAMFVDRAELRYFLLMAAGHVFTIFEQYGDLVVKQECPFDEMTCGHATEEQQDAVDSLPL